MKQAREMGMLIDWWREGHFAAVDVVDHGPESFQFFFN